MRRLAPLLVAVLLSACDCSGGDDGPGPQHCRIDVAELVPSDAERGVLVVLSGESSAGFYDGKNARMNGAGGAAITDDGSILITDIFNATVRLYVPQSRANATFPGQSEGLFTIAGFPLSVGAVDGRCGEARMNGPRSVAINPQSRGTAYVGDGPCIRELSIVNGIVTTITGDCATPGNVDGALADARFGFIVHDLAVHDDGRLFVADRQNNAIRVVDVRANSVSTLVGEGLNGPGGLALQGDMLYVANTFDHIITSVDLTTGETLRLAGRRGSPGSLDGPQGTGTLTAPQALTIVGDTLIAAGFDGVLRAVNVDTAVLSTIGTAPAGFFGPFTSDGSAVFGGDLDGTIQQISLDGTVTRLAGPQAPAGYRDADGRSSRFELPIAVVADNNGNVLVTDGPNQALRKVNLLTGQTSTVVGGPGLTVLDFPTGLALSADGARAFVVDNGNGTIVSVELSTQAVTEVASGLFDAWEIVLDEVNGRAFVVDVAVAIANKGSVNTVDLATGDMTVLTEDLTLPFGLAFIDGRLFVSDNEDHTVNELDVTTGAKTILLGTPGFQGSEDGPAELALLNFPAGLFGRVEDGVPVLYVTETGGQTVRRVNVTTGESRFVVGNPFLSGGMPAGARTALEGAPLLNPVDIAVVGDDIVIVGDTTVLIAKP